MKLRNALALAVSALVLGGCKVVIDVPTSGSVTSASGAFDCAAGEVCTIDVSDAFFDETFTAVPAEGFTFTGWKQQEGSLCPGRTDDCWLTTTFFGGNDGLMSFVEDPDLEYHLVPGFQSVGFKSLFIGHSFFRPFAEGMPFHAGENGIDEHTQTIVMAGGPNGAPEALWNNESKRAEIQAVLDEGGVELFAMTYHPDYPTLTGYELWIDYALQQNPDVRFAIALPWLFYPNQFDTEQYAALWSEFHEGDFQLGIDVLRSRYPNNEFFALPYGEAAIELRRLYDAGQLTDVDTFMSKAVPAIYRDELGHADDILIELGQLIWASMIYDVDLSSYDYEPPYEADLKGIAKQIVDSQNPIYRAPYR